MGEKQNELVLTVILRDVGDSYTCESKVEGGGNVKKLLTMGYAANEAIIETLHDLTMDELSETFGKKLVKEIAPPKHVTAKCYFDDIVEFVIKKLKEDKQDKENLN